MGCGACTSKKSAAIVPLAPALHKSANQLYAALRKLPTPSQYKRALIEWSEIRMKYSETTQPFLEYKREKPQEFLEKLASGPPAEYRWEVWNVAINSQDDSSHYKELLAASIPGSVENDIKKDIGRTYPEYDYFQTTGTQALFNVLKCLAVSDSEVGYCQGMNFVIGMLLLISGGEEAETFNFYKAISKQFQWRDLYRKNFPKMWEMTYQWRVLGQEALPEVYTSLQSQGVQEALWLTKCIMTVFTVALPMALVVRIWDLLLSEGHIVILKSVVTLISLIKTDLVGKELAEVATVFRDLPKRQIDIEDFIAKTRLVKIPEDLLKQGSDLYKAKVQTEGE